MKKLLIIFLLLLPLFGSEIKRYDIKMHLFKNGVLQVKEDIYYLFDNEKEHHGIYRDIPLKVKYKYHLYILPFNNLKVLQDDKNATYKTKLVQKNNYYIDIKIGSPKKSVAGLHKYTIMYNTILPTFLVNKNFEKISINAVGTEWRVPIKKAVATLILPKDINKSQVKVKSYMGYYNSITSTASINWKNNHTLKVKVKDLEPYEGLTIDLYFPKGTITSTLKEVSLLKRFWYWLLLIPITWYLYYITKDYHNKIDAPIIVRYNPPKNISVLQSALLYNTAISNDDFVAAIIELATKGKITINYQDKKTILKVKNYDISDLTLDLQMLFNALFQESDSFVIEKDRDTQSYLSSVFSQIESELENIELNKGFIFKSFEQEHNSFFLKSLIVYLPLLVFALYQIYLHYKFIGNYIAILGSFIISVITVIFFTFKNASEFLIAFLNLLFLIYMIFNYGNGWQEFLLGPVGVLFVFSFIWAFFYLKVADYTKKGLYIKNYLKGLKEFIKSAKKDQIATLLKEDPNFLDKLMPYAIMFGLNKHWLEFYEIFELKPKWYEGDFYYMGTFYSDFTESMGGGLSGGSGGFSGGGAIGGGGGDW